ncbi:glutamate--tRNA ligase [Deltaproteobacteria bacterium]|nr:glutamate--tRNA ligase [Deltaproteobacteria bacterium]
MAFRTRFAPSPTGYLHIGGARTALFNWLIARKTGGQFLLRIEDTDEDRNKEEAVDAILDGLTWLGITWDEGPGVGGPNAPYRQSERLDQYRAVADRLLAEGKAYRCTCSVERLTQLRDAAKESGGRRGYDGHCRDRKHGPEVGPAAIRLVVPASEPVELFDLIKGPVTWDSAELDDFILVRPDGMPMYNFVVACDDVAMGITHVLRGDEHLNNTPKQLLVYAAMGVQRPQFGHMPLIHDDQGRKMSKRYGDVAVGLYKEKGFLPEALVNYLARLGWAHGDAELFGVAELTAMFSIDGIGASAAKWDMQKLLWVNAHWMKNLPLERIAADTRPFFEARGYVLHDRWVDAVRALRERSNTLAALAESAGVFFLADDAIAVDAQAVADLLTPARALVAKAADAFEAAPEWTEAALEAAGNALCLAEGVKLGKLAQPLRVALVGQKVGPGLWQTLYILGRETSLRRLRAGWESRAT